MLSGQRHDWDPEISYQAKIRYQDKGIAERYDQERFSSLLGRWVNHLEKKTLLNCMKELMPEDTVLDIPLGTGRIAAFLLSRGFQVAGADISEEMMALAKNRLRGFPNFMGAYLEDAEHLSFPDGSFDAVVSVRFMLHLPPPVRIKILKEMKRVARKGLFVAYCVSGFTTEISKFLQGIGKKSGDLLYPGTKKQMEEEMDEAGLEIIRDLPMLRFVSEAHYLALRSKRDRD
jgi:ubiquinone/menaquinone biosynthesis C-methylase UbiE